MVKAKKDVKRSKDEELDIEDLMSTANYIYLQEHHSLGSYKSKQEEAKDDKENQFMSAKQHLSKPQKKREPLQEVKLNVPY
jgi:hypothetical protein